MRERGAGFYHGLAIAAVVIWGTTFVSTKVLLTEGLSPAAIMFLRFLIAYAVLRTVCPRNERPVRFKDELMFAAAGITGGSMYFLTENMALQITLVSNVALLLTTSPIMTVLLSRLFFRRTEPFGRPGRAGDVGGVGRSGAGGLQWQFYLADSPVGATC